MEGRGEWALLCLIRKIRRDIYISIGHPFTPSLVILTGSTLSLLIYCDSIMKVTFQSWNCILLLSIMNMESKQKMTYFQEEETCVLLMRTLLHSFIL